MSNETDAEKRTRLFDESRERYAAKSKAEAEKATRDAADAEQKRRTLAAFFAEPAFPTPAEAARTELERRRQEFRDGKRATAAPTPDEERTEAEAQARLDAQRLRARINASGSASPPKAPPKIPSRKGELKLLLKLAASMELKSPERLILAALYSYTDGRGFCFPGAETLLDMTGLSDRRIRTALDTLRDVGIVPALKAEKSGQFTFGKGGRSLRRGQSLYLVWPIATDTGKQHFILMLRNAYPGLTFGAEVRANAAKLALLPLSEIERVAAEVAKRRAEQTAPVPPQSATG